MASKEVARQKGLNHASIISSNLFRTRRCLVLSMFSRGVVGYIYLLDHFLTEHLVEFKQHVNRLAWTT